MIQRQPEEEEEEPIEELEEKEKPIMTKALSHGTLQVTESLRAGLNRSKGGGQKLPETDRNFMGKRFGINFRAVKIHTDNNAAQMSRELNAEAFTYGKDIFFRAGRYNPGTSSYKRKRILAHELTHVVQQSKGIPLCGNSPNRGIIQRLSIRDQGIPPPGWSLVPENEISRLVSAREIVERVLVRQGSWRREGPCFRHFRENCPGGGENVFREVFYAANLWRNPSTRGNLYGEGERGGSNISYTQRAYREGIWMLAGTIVHELMHNCGVTDERICEEALRHCGRLPQVPVGQRDTGGRQPEELGFPFFERLLNSIATDQGLSLTFVELSPGSSELHAVGTMIFYNPYHQYWQDASRADLEMRAEEMAERWFRSRR